MFAQNTSRIKIEKQPRNDKAENGMKSGRTGANQKVCGSTDIVLLQGL